MMFHVDSAAVATEKVRLERQDILDALFRLINFFSSHADDEILQHVPEFPVLEFQAERAELWLWNDTSNSLYLVHWSGVTAQHRQDYITAGEGVLGKVADSRKAVENIPLSSSSGQDQEFARQHRLNYLSCYPLLSFAGHLQGLLAVYSKTSVPEPVVALWRTYAEMCTIKVPDVLDSQQKQKQITQLSLLFEATRLLNSTLDLAELLELILKIARQQVKADRGSVFLVDHKDKELWSIVAFGLDHQEIRMPWGKGIAGRVAETGETVNVENAYELSFFEPSFDQRFNYRTRSLLGMPIRHHSGQIVGVIQLLNKTTGSHFTAEDEDFLSKLSGHMALALENARLHRESLEKQRMEKELALARGIQRSLLPDEPPVIPGFELAVANEPCFECGGDYYDFLHLGPQSLLLVVADVEGKGVSSALVMSNLQATLRALVMHLHSLEVLALSLNEMIYNDTKSEKYLSCFLGLVDTRRNGLHYINAGHVPPILVDGATGTYSLLEEGGTVVGLFPKTDYTRGTTQLKSGDILVCCTDGILEAANEHDEEFGSEKLAASVIKHRDRSAPAILESVLAEVNQWCHGVQADDKVLMVMKVNTNGTITRSDSTLPKPHVT
jgi:sigma-B regulation protein RsbU (phosphoserine phosphatase)